MTTILEQITEHKKVEVAERQSLYPTKLLERSLYFSSTPVSLTRYLRRPDKVGIIAEVKRASPSKGVFHKHISVENLTLGYMQAGASALSILTDSKFFGGSLEDLATARRFNFCPILRKDFMIDPYQVIEAKAKGADVILLIAAAISPKQSKELGALAHTLGLEVLLEVRSQDEIDAYAGDHIDLIGVNNRDLADFSVSIEKSLELAPIIPSQFVKVTESGIHNAATISTLRDVGYQGFLIGEAFMKTTKPASACGALVEEVRRLSV